MYMFFKPTSKNKKLQEIYTIEKLYLTTRTTAELIGLYLHSTVSRNPKQSDNSVASV